MPKIGAATWVRKSGKILLGLRSKKSGNNTWGPPGGHLEMNETLIECAMRETKEEAGIAIKNIRFMTYGEDIHREQESHYVAFYFVADWESGDLVPDPTEFSALDWFDWENLPKPLFRPAQQFVSQEINPIIF